MGSGKHEYWQLGFASGDQHVACLNPARQQGLTRQTPLNFGGAVQVESVLYVQNILASADRAGRKKILYKALEKHHLSWIDLRSNSVESQILYNVSTDKTEYFFTWYVINSPIPSKFRCGNAVATAESHEGISNFWKSACLS